LLKPSYFFLKASNLLNKLLLLFIDNCDFIIVLFLLDCDILVRLIEFFLKTFNMQLHLLLTLNVSSAL
jgi:hypothetical protein